jgi:hypothetical protein
MKAFVDLYELDTTKSSLRRVIEGATTHIESQFANRFSRVVYIVRPSQVTEAESILMGRDSVDVVGVMNTDELLTKIKSSLKTTDQFIPNDSTVYVFTFSPSVKEKIFEWKRLGLNAYHKPAVDFLFVRRSEPASAEIDRPQGQRTTRNRRYDLAKNKAKKFGIYAEWRVRKEIYNVLEAAATAGQNHTLDELKRLVRREAREAAKRAGFDLAPNHFFAANEAVFKVAVTLGVLKNGTGQSVTAKDVPFVVTITAIDPDFRDQCDLKILETIINELGDVTDDHLLALAHVLYGEGIPEAEGGVSIEDLAERLAKLMKKFGSRLSRTEHGYYRVAPIGSEKVVRLAAHVK